MNDKKHLFEQAGLGKAPFSVEGWFEGNATPAPNMPKITSCDYCSTAIKNCFRINSSDGKSFIVGSECVKKTGDKGMIDFVKRELARKKSEEDFTKAQELRERVKNLDSEVVSKLEAQPHPWKSELTMFDYAYYIFNHGWTITSARRVLKALK